MAVLCASTSPVPVGEWHLRQAGLRACMATVVRDLLLLFCRFLSASAMCDRRWAAKGLWGGDDKHIGDDVPWHALLIRLRERAGCLGAMGTALLLYCQASSHLGTMCEWPSEAVMSWGCCLIGGKLKGSRCSRAVSGGTGSCCRLFQELLSHCDWGTCQNLGNSAITLLQGA